MDPGSRHGMTDLYHGNHYDVITLPRDVSGAAIHGAHSTEFKDSDDLGCLPISRKVPVEARFETPAIVRGRWRSCLKVLCLQTPGIYDGGRLGPPSVFAEESRNLRNRNSARTRLTCPMDLLANPAKRIPEQELKSPPFVRTLAEATIRASTTEGPQVEFNADRFRTLSVSLRKYADEDDVLQVEILNAAQVTVAKLNHPPGLLHNVFYHLYDVETIKETTFIDWLKRGTEDTGRGVALQSVKGFFDWLENADPESDNESGT